MPRDMKNDWWFKFEYSKWDDPSLQLCRMETQGFWLRIYLALRKSAKADITAPVEKLASLAGCTVTEAIRSIVELKLYDVAGVTLCNGQNVTRNSLVTLLSRSLKRELSDKEKTRLRVQKHRGNADVTVDVTVQSKSNKKEVEEEKKEETHKAASPPKGSRLPEPFLLTKEMRDYAFEKRPTLDVSEETEKFCNYWRSKTGRDATKLDWPATWRNWILNAKGNGNGTNHKPSEREKSASRTINAERMANALYNGDDETLRSILGVDDENHIKGYLPS